MQRGAAPVEEASTGPGKVTPGAWRRALGASRLDWTVQVDDPRAFQGSLRSRWVGDFQFFELECSRHVASVEGRVAPTEGDSCLLMPLQLSGTLSLAQDDRTGVLRPGEFSVYASDRPVRLEASDDCAALCVQFPVRALHFPTELLRERTAVVLDAGDGIAPVVWSLLTALGGTAPGAATGVGRSVLLDSAARLIRSMLLPAGAAPAPPAVGLREVMDHITARLSDVDLTPRRIAEGTYTSLRRLHTLFEPTGVSVSTWVREQRLERCRADLADPALAAVPVAAIGRSWGFRT
ncbi:AraC family transcriptional regulator, partial [Pseudonocardia pini]|uniref:AraC family transcriptional regulator n=1 Tax=Pseudonocardia pini TaxID=2758030 RepID=UPI0015EFEB83